MAVVDRRGVHFLDVEIPSVEQSFHPTDQVIANNDDVDREALLYADFMSDGTVVMLYEMTNCYDQFERELRAHSSVVFVKVFETPDGFNVFIKASSDGYVKTLLNIANDNLLLLDTPMECTENGLQVTLIGPYEQLRKAFTAMRNEVELEMKNTGEYIVDGNNVLSAITDRQMTVLETAYRLGYYDVPRQATQQDVASALGLCPSTVTEHLHKAESVLISDLFG